VSPDQEENINVQNLKYGSHKMHNNAFTVWWGWKIINETIVS
jgi:hypothetical protein